MQPDRDTSLSDEATFAGRPRPQRTDASLGDERTLGDGLVGQDTVIDGMEVVNLALRYRIEGTLGQGGMGAVLLATDTRLDRKVAIKRILGEASRSQTAVSRFLTEAKSIAALSHPNIVVIHDYGRAKDGPFLVMEYVDGGSLLDRCRDGALPLEEAIDLACQLCDGLAKAHDLGIIHRDIKPANVLLTKDGTPKLTDFGLAKAQANDHGQTMTGAVLGTPDFMPPEQRKDASLVDARSDLWSLAATVYQMVTGKSPKIIRFNNVPESLQEVLGKALEDAKEDRYQTVRKFRQAIRSAIDKPARRPIAPTSDLAAGECPMCHEPNEATRKFCRNADCAAPLRVNCLAPACGHEIPVWDKVCPECGAKQPVLIVARQQQLQAQRLRAEELLSHFDFNGALTAAKPMSIVADVRLQEFRLWGETFVTHVAEERSRQETVAASRFSDAQAHRLAFDHSAAIVSLEGIPSLLRLPPMESLLSECRALYEESTLLLRTIADRIAHKDLPGLLDDVERSLVVCGGRADLEKLQKKLTERRDAKVGHAFTCFEQGDAKTALAAFNGLAPTDLRPADTALFANIVAASNAEERLAALVRSSKEDGVVDSFEASKIQQAAEFCRGLNPRNAKLKPLIDQCERLQTLRNTIGMELKLIPAGKFQMGEDGDVVAAALTRPFWLGKTEVTQRQWEAVMGTKPWSGKSDADLPATDVSWDDATEFCKKLTQRERGSGNLPANEEYRLPTEAEWEYACRAGTTTAFSFGDDESKLGDFAWFYGNSGKAVHKVGTKQANPWGLYDMHGNVWEWCSDWYEALAGGADPAGPGGGSNRVLRGGSGGARPVLCRSANRGIFDPSYRYVNLGFRVARSQSVQ